MTTSDTVAWLVVKPVDLPKSQRFEYAATPKQCAALAQRFAVLEIRACRFQVLLERTTWSGISRLSGVVYGTIIQSCVVSLEPVQSVLQEPFACYTGTEAALARLQQSVEWSDDEDPAEPWYADGSLDISEVAIQYLALAIPAYPHASPLA